MATATELIEARELFRNLTLRELRGKYKRSALGWTWSMLNPLATMAIFSFVFLVVFKAKPEVGDPSGLKNFPLFLLCGLLPWNYLATGLTGGMGAPIQNAALIKKVYFPREILTASVVASWGVQLAIELSVLGVALILVGNNIVPYLPGIVLLMLIQSVFVYGLALGFGAVNVYFRDVQHFLGIALQFWFYSTPIVYQLNLVPAKQMLFGREIALRSIYELNPMVRFIEAYRHLFYDLRYPSITELLYLVGVSLLVLLIGRGIFLKVEPRFAEEL